MHDFPHVPGKLNRLITIGNRWRSSKILKPVAKEWIFGNLIDAELPQIQPPGKCGSRRNGLEDVVDWLQHSRSNRNCEQYAKRCKRKDKPGYWRTNLC